MVVVYVCRNYCLLLPTNAFFSHVQVTDSKDLQVPFSTAASLGYGLHHMLHLPPQFLHPLDHRLPFGGFRPLGPSAFAPPSKCLKVEVEISRERVKHCVLESTLISYEYNVLYLIVIVSRLLIFLYISMQTK